jgi:predicted dehydrogenase
MSEGKKMGDGSRRDFLKTSTVAAGAALAGGLTLVPNVHAAGSDMIKVGLIGCGGRGTGAAANVLSSAKGVKVHALGDAFKFQIDGCSDQLQRFLKDDSRPKELGNSVDVEGRTFAGLNAYKEVIDSGVDYVILATPPGFRPLHIEAAVAAGKTIFTEKPVGVDGPGLRKVFKAYEESLRKGLAIAAGTQRRHQGPYIDTINAIHDGAIGDIVSGRVFWMQDILWARDARPEMTTEVAKQMWNWYNYTWICGDHIVEQHIHNIDVANWAIGHHPESATGMGFRTRTDPRYGHIYDFFAIDYGYPKNVHVLSMCRQISGCKNEVGEHLYGTRGYCHVNAYNINGKNMAKGGGIDPYVQEHTDLIHSLRSGKPINELKNVAESTLAAIMGRMSAYTGKQVSWEQALNSREQLMPDDLTWDTKLPQWHVAMPGKTPLL